MKSTGVRNSIGCIILNWNSGEFIDRCLQSLQSSRGVDTRILVVDNGSTDGSAEIIAERFPSVANVRLPRNVGVAAGWNKGIEVLLQNGCESVFLMNSDATVEPDCLNLLLGALESETAVGAVTPRIMDGVDEGKIWFDGGEMNAFGHPFHPGMGKAPGSRAEPFVEDFGSGCALLIRRAALDQIGRFDESFFAYAEDTEFCIRLRKAGWKILHVPSARAVHFPSGSVRHTAGKWFRDYYVARNALLLGRRTTSGFRWFLFLAQFLLASLAVPIAYFLLSGQLRRASAVFRGIIDFTRGRTGKRYG